MEAACQGILEKPILKNRIMMRRFESFCDSAPTENDESPHRRTRRKPELALCPFANHAVIRNLNAATGRGKRSQAWQQVTIQ